jgi:hypothetical protein
MVLQTFYFHRSAEFQAVAKILRLSSAASEVISLGGVQKHSMGLREKELGGLRVV